MFSTRQINPIIKCKQICVLFIFLFSITKAVVAQSFPEFERLTLAQQDSLAQVEKVKDSINLQSISLQSIDGAFYLDSIKSIVIVDDNNFVRWMHNMNSFSKESKCFTQMNSVAKVQRPAWILVSILVLLVSIGLVRIFFYINFHNIVYGFYNDRILAQINKEDNILTSWPYIFLYLIFSLSLGLFISLYQSYVLHQKDVEFSVFLKISVVIGLLFLLKIIFIRMIGILFEVEKIIREYTVFLYLFYFNSVLILMPLLLLVTFMPSLYFNFLLILFILIIVILFLYRGFKTILLLIGGLRFSIFYFILYLCTLEIAPILILVKALNN